MNVLLERVASILDTCHGWAGGGGGQPHFRNVPRTQEGQASHLPRRGPPSHGRTTDTNSRAASRTQQPGTGRVSVTD